MPGRKAAFASRYSAFDLFFSLPNNFYSTFQSFSWIPSPWLTFLPIFNKLSSKRFHFFYIFIHFCFQLDLATALRLQKTSRWGLNVVDDCPHPLYRSLSQIRKVDKQPLSRCFAKPWRGTFEEACNFRVCRQLMEDIQMSSMEFVEEKRLLECYVRVWESLFKAAVEELNNSCLQMRDITIGQ